MKLTLTSPVQQTPQANGFYLLSTRLQADVQAHDLMGKSFGFSNSPIELSLFMADGDRRQWQFISPASLPDIESQSELSLKTSVLDSFRFPDKQSPCIVLASEKFMGNAFAIAKQRHNLPQSTVVMISANRFPFQLKPARFWSPEMPDEAIGTSTLLEDWGVVNRMASSEMLPGCFHGQLDRLFAEWAMGVQSTYTQQKQAQQTQAQPIQTTQPQKVFATWNVVILAEKDCRSRCLDVCQSTPFLRPL